jgi:hypothetical protein
MLALKARFCNLSGVVSSQRAEAREQRAEQVKFRNPAI